MYKQGDLLVYIQNKEEEEEEEDIIFDSRTSRYNVKSRDCYLPHSCNEWIIGGPQQVKALIKDLQTYLEKVKG